MKTGIELIAQERAEQIEKHGYTNQHDTDEYPDLTDLHLQNAAIGSITGEYGDFPASWSESRNNPYLLEIRC